MHNALCYAAGCCTARRAGLCLTRRTRARGRPACVRVCMYALARWDWAAVMSFRQQQLVPLESHRLTSPEPEPLESPNPVHGCAHAIRIPLPPSACLPACFHHAFLEITRLTTVLIFIWPSWPGCPGQGRAPGRTAASSSCRIIALASLGENKQGDRSSCLQILTPL